MAKVISANYRSRNSKYRWLVRDKSQRPEDAIACASVRVMGRTVFTQSSEYEEGFGCKVVAETTGTVVMDDIEPSQNMRELKFDGFGGFQDDHGNYVRLTLELDLKSDGTILANFDRH